MKQPKALLWLIIEKSVGIYVGEGEKQLERDVADHFCIFGGLLASVASGVWHSLQSKLAAGNVSDR